jgi:hypothetical protein
VTHADRPAFAKGLYVLGETFNEPVSEVRAEAYFDALADLSAPAVLEAIRKAVAECRFFPRPTELREMVAGRLEDRAELAWMAVLRLVRRHGYPGIDGRGKAPDFPDDATRRAALELYGGWVALCERLPGEGPELLGVAKNFRSAYAAYVRAGAAVAAALPPGETGRELSADEARAALGSLKVQLERRGLPTGSL